MEITKFKLLDDGRTGVEVWGKEVSSSNLSGNQMNVIDDMSRKRRIPLKRSLRMEIDKLKYFFLSMAGYWVTPYDKYFDHDTLSPAIMSEGKQTAEQGKTLIILKDLFNRTTITGVSKLDDGFIITGSVEVFGNKKMGLATPKLTEDDENPFDSGFYNHALDEINAIFGMISEFIGKSEMTLEQALFMLINHGMDTKQAEEMPEDEAIRMALDLLEGKGFVVLTETDIQEAVKDNKKKKEKKTAPEPEVVIDPEPEFVADNEPEFVAEEQEDWSDGKQNLGETIVGSRDFDMDEVDKQLGYKGNHAGGILAGKDLADMEYSENIPGGASAGE